MKDKDILFLCQYFYPEYNSSATLPFDTARHLASIGYTVDALCGYPKEYFDGGKVRKRETVDGVHIKRLRYLHLKRASTVGRLLNFISFTWSVLCHLPYFRHYQSVIVYSNPPVLPLLAVIAKKLFGLHIIFVSYDVYPEIAYRAGTFGKGHPMARLMRFINTSLYRNVSAVVALSEDMKAFLCSHRDIAPSKVFVIPNWASEEKESEPRPVPLSVAPFTVAYFGNMGLMQDMETLLDACRMLQNENIVFQFTGHGNKFARVEEVISDNNHADICGFLIGDAFEKRMQQASCCVVTLERGLKGLCAPSKYYSYLCAGKPVVYVGAQDDALFCEIQSEEIGIAVEVGDAITLSEQLRRLSCDKEALRRMGDKAMQLYEKKYRRSLGMQKYEVMMRAVYEEE